MISLLRRNRKKNNNTTKTPQRPMTRSLISDSHEDDSQHPSVEIYNDSSLDSLMFAASLGLISTHSQHSAKDVMLVVQDPSSQKKNKQQLQQQQQQQNQQLEFQCRFCGKGYRWKSTMRRHETLECGDKPPSFQCPQCPYKARQRGNLTVHLKRHHMKN